MVKLEEWEKAWINLFASFSVTLLGILFWAATWITASKHLGTRDIANIDLVLVIISPLLVAIGLCFTTYSLLQIWSIMDGTVEETATLY